MSADVFNTVVTDCAGALGRVGDLFAGDKSGQAILARLGWRVDALPAPLLTLGNDLRALRPLISEARAHPDSDDVWLSLASSAIALITDIHNLHTQSFGPDLDAAGFGVQFAGQLLQWAALEQLGRAHPTLLAILRAAGIVSSTRHAGAAARPPYVEERFVLPDFGALFTSPATLLRVAWAWGDPAFDGTGLLQEIVAIFRTLGVPAGFIPVPPSPRELQEVGPGAIRWHVLARFLSGSAGGANYEAGMRFLNLRDGADPAIAILPYVEGSITEAVPFGEGYQILITGAASLEEGRALLLSPSSIRLVDDLFGTSGASPTGQISVTLSRQQASPVAITVGPAVLQSTGWSIRAAAQSGEGSDSEFLIEASLTDARVGIPPGDGLLSSLFGADAAMVAAPLVLGVSSSRGLYVGASGLSQDFVVSLRIGGLEVRTISLKLGGVDSGFEAAVTVTVAANVGPVNLVVSGLGVSLGFRFPGSGGNLGVIDLTPDLIPPTGAGLSIDSAGVSGGGFLKHDDAKHEYEGVLQLEFNNLSLQAFGLITTQVAGASGYSLLALIDADFPPVELGWGFTLNGVGGLLAVNRTASTDALHAALKANSLSSILFPANAITNAPQILATLDAIFPTASGRFLFGPMALIGWGTPTVLTAAIAIIIELPEPIRIVLIARLAVRFPSASAPLVKINLDALGILDLSQDLLSLDAALFDSKLLDFTLTGDMALRANWSSSQKEFLLAIGGFHPQFAPPAGFPALQRITIDMPSGPISKLRLSAYLAVSSNTVQFGATLDVLIGVSEFGLLGHLGFDALLQLSPFHFEADVSGQVTLTAGGDDLMSVGLDATLTGPAPWNIAGNFKIHIVFFDVTKSFSYSWGQDAPAQQIAPVDVLSMVTTALADARSWGAALPSGTPALVSLKNPGTPVVHPLALLEVHESVVPLGLSIAQFGSAPVTGATSFTITDYQVNGTTVPHESIEDDFAPAQFFDLTEEEKLARPSFETHDAGVRLMGAGLVKCGAPTAKTLTYETFYIDYAGETPRGDTVTAPKTFGIGDLSSVISFGASGRAAIRAAGHLRYTAPGTPVKVAAPSFVIANRNTLSAALAGTAKGTTYSDLQATLQAAVAQDSTRRASLQIIAVHELPVS